MQIDEKDFLSFITVKQGLSTQSIRHCRIRLKIINEFLLTNELNKECIEKFFQELMDKGLKNNTLNTYRFVLRQLRDYCSDRELPSNFLDGFKSFKKSKPDIVVFTLEEIDRLLNTNLKYGDYHGKSSQFLDFTYLTLTMFLAFTGCRFSEAVNLKVKRIDISAGRATFIDTKTNENRSVYFTDPLKGRIAHLIKDKNLEEYIFTNVNGNKVNAQDYSFDLKKRAGKAQIKKRVFPHNFRHSYITHLIEAEVPITEVASLVGHKDIQTTYNNYMHLADNTLRKAAFRHPSVRKNVSTKEILKGIKENLENLHLDSDRRFKYKIVESENKIELEIEAI